ncbi:MULTISPECIES: antitoxin Xre/MbcA/ParS toxin-binding domain-containing protein [unclassified Dyella]|uniref:antitoxin Xre/MbcA/ParS toxin-binding domain-containing protein n=1 Tax=unclassified Dyella TaxID=2634549 RepID=UPI003F9364C6
MDNDDRLRLAVERVADIAESISGDRDKAIEWMSQPLATFAGRTALELIAEGSTDDVIGYLQSCSSGYVG